MSGLNAPSGKLLLIGAVVLLAGGACALFFLNASPSGNTLTSREFVNYLKSQAGSESANPGQLTGMAAARGLNDNLVLETEVLDNSLLRVQDVRFVCAPDLNSEECRTNGDSITLGEGDYYFSVCSNPSGTGTKGVTAFGLTAISANEACDA